MKKKTAGIIYGILLFGIMATVVNAQVSTPNFFKKVGNAILMLQTPWELGSSSARVAKGWFTNLDSTNATIGSLQISSSVTPGPLTVAASSNPDIRFTGDTNTGISWIDADRMALMTGGTNRLTVNSSGNVGIGTANPLAKLTVVGSDDVGANAFDIKNSSGSSKFTINTYGQLSNNGYISWSGSGFYITGAGSLISPYVYGSTSASGNLTLESTNNAAKGYVILQPTSGNVGIGTTSPSVKLEVNGNVKANGGSANKVMCWKSDAKTLGYCSDAPAADGSCTCN